MKLNLNVLLICNQPELVEHIKALMAELGQEVDVLHSMDAFEDEYSRDLDLCLLDASQACEVTFELTARLRAVHPLVGLVCFTKSHCVPKRIQAFKSGADHVMSQPLDPEEFKQMMGSLIHRLQLSPSALHAGASDDLQRLELSSQKRSICGPEEEINLTSTEYLLLQSLARAKDRALEIWQIYDLLGKNEQTLQKPALEAQLYRLRKKLRDCGAGNQALKAVRLKGYQLCVPIQIS